MMIPSGTICVRACACKTIRIRIRPVWCVVDPHPDQKDCSNGIWSSTRTCSVGVVGFSTEDPAGRLSSVH